MSEKRIPLTDKALQIMEDRMCDALDKGEVIETSNGELATLLICLLREIRELHTYILDRDAEAPKERKYPDVDFANR